MRKQMKKMLPSKLKGVAMSQPLAARAPTKTPSKAVASTIDINAEHAGTIKLRSHRVSCDVREEFLEHACAPVSVVFLRPAMRKVPAVSLYNDLIAQIDDKLSRWATFHFKTHNSERVHFDRFADFRARMDQSLISLFGDKSYVLVAYEPEDGVAAFLRAISPNASLVVIGSVKYVSENPVVADAADLVIAIGKKIADPGPINLMIVGSERDVAPVLKHWVESWIFERNRSYLPLFGSKEDLALLNEQFVFEHEEADLLCISRPRPVNAVPSSRLTCELRRSFSKRVDAAYIRIAHQHKYLGLIENGDLSNCQKLDELIKRGLLPALILKDQDA